MNYKTIKINTSGERFYNITNQIKQEVATILKDAPTHSGILVLFIPHTSCGLTISEAFDPSATDDMKMFLDHIAPRKLPFITHTSEGSDDSPSHMKSIVLSPSLSIIMDNGNMVLGSWQGIFLTEFRDLPKTRKINIKFMPDPDLGDLDDLV